MDEMERMWVGALVKIKKLGNVKITARRLKYVGLYFDMGVGEGHLCTVFFFLH